ncbi:hypothetical protein Tco_0240290, partial [Tanacetum coccineum]
KEYEDDETEDGPVDYPIDGGEDGDEDDGDSSGDDTDDEDGDEEDKEEEEEHLAMADSAVIPPPSTDITTTGARITVRLQASISLPPEAKVKRLLAMPTPPPSPLISLSPPSAGERLARDDVLESELSPRKRLCLSNLDSRYEIRESSTARPTRGLGVDYGFVSTIDA